MHVRRHAVAAHHPARPSHHRQGHAVPGHAHRRAQGRLTHPGDVFQAHPSRGGLPHNFRAGAWGGQCLAWVNKTSGRPMWNFCAKNCLNNHPGWTRVSSPRPGDLFVCTWGQYGHIGYVVGVNGNGTVTVADSNWNLDEREHLHTMSMSSIAGYLR